MIFIIEQKEYFIVKFSLTSEFRASDTQKTLGNEGRTQPSIPLVHFHFPEPGESRSIIGIEGGNEEQDSIRVGGDERTVLLFPIA